MVEFNGNNFVAYDNNQTNPINKNTTIFTATFKVKSGLSAGTKLTVSVKDLVTSDGKADTNVGTVSYTTTILPPKSTDNTLKSLTVSNATISPAFSPNVTSYTASVPYEVSKLDLSYKTNDSKATVSVSNPTLTVDGTTKVTITVTSESGSSKIYTITVTRAQDPNYVPSGNNDLSGITVNGFLLSPAFQADQTTYMVWLPYETDSIQVSGTAADKKASVEVVGGSNLVAGADNEVKVICTAENGEKKTYTIIAKRAAAHNAPQAPTTYTVFWIVDGVVTMETYEAGAAPSFKGETAKAADEDYTYTFTGWDKELTAVNADASYVAQYTKTAIQKPVYYTVSWVVDGRVTTETYEAGATPSFKGETAKAADEHYTYVFAGWDKEIAAVTADVTYVAKYSKTAIGQTVYYTVFWVVDGNVTMETYEAGATPSFKGETAKAADEDYTYTFVGWDKELVAVNADITYVAQYTKTAIEKPIYHTVFWIVDGKVTAETYEAGAMPSFKGETAKVEDDYFTYVFAGWSEELAAVSGDAAYVARYDATAKQQPETPVDPGEDPGENPEATQPTSPQPTTPKPTESTPTKPTGQDSDVIDNSEKNPQSNVSILAVVVAALIGMAVGSVAVLLVKKLKK